MDCNLQTIDIFIRIEFLYICFISSLGSILIQVTSVFSAYVGHCRSLMSVKYYDI